MFFQLSLSKKLLSQSSRLCSGAIGDRILFDVETNFSARRFGRWRSHELTDSVEDRFELRIVFSFQVSQFAGKLGISQEYFTHTHKGAHDGDVYLCCAPAPKHAGQH